VKNARKEEDMEKTARRRVAIVTDSTADLPSELVEAYGIRVVPQVLIMGDQTWLDGVDIDPPTFYQLLQTSPHFPSTSQPSVRDFHEVFVELSKEADGIAAILISNELSGTMNSALAAKASLPQVPIEIVDSRGTSMMLGLIVLAAARAAAEGKDLQAVADTARALVGKTHVYFVVDTLEYLHRGGRIGAAARLFGTALNLKPVLTIREGIIQPVTKVRTRRKSLQTVHELVQEQLRGKTRIQMAVVHVAAPQEAAQFVEQLKAKFQPVELIKSECGPVVGTHAGPGTVGVAFYAENG
jgi:DegV family protein with EDD domain